MTEIFENKRIPVTNEDISRLRNWLAERGLVDSFDTDTVLEEAEICFGEGYTKEDIRAIVITLGQREQEAAEAADTAAGM